MDIQNLERKIKDKKLRIGIEESAEQGIVCGNVLICCIASLNDYINRSEQKQAAYSQRRAYLAKQAKDLLRMDVGYIRDKIYRLSPECYPSLKATGRVCDMLADSGREKSIDNSFVPDKLMRYLSDEDAKKFHNRKGNPTKRESKPESFIINDENFIGVCDLIKKEFFIDLTDKMQKEMAALQDDRHGFLIMLKTCQFNKGTICRSLCKKEFNSAYSKFKYLLKIIESMSPDALKQIKHEEEEEQSFWMHNAKAVLSGDETLESMVRIQCDEDPNTLHYGQHEYVTKRLKDAMAQLERNNDDSELQPVYAEPIEHTGASYQRVTEDDVYHQFDDLW